jgi:hypothetical protein
MTAVAERAVLSRLSEGAPAVFGVSLLPESAVRAGAINDPAGTHTSRTLMLSELRGLIRSCTESATYEDYENAAVIHNAVDKGTLATRRKTFRHLRELYGLRPSWLIFRSLRDLWNFDVSAQPMLAVLCGCARDPLLRVSANVILDHAIGQSVVAHDLATSIEDGFPGRYRPDTLARCGRNLASSWTQSGHLIGRTNKKRARANATIESTAYGLFLGHICGLRGDSLFQSLWARLLDQPEHAMRAQAIEASSRGYLEYRHAGSVTDIQFSHLSRPPTTPL